MNKILYKYLVSTPLKLQNTFCPSFPQTFTQKDRENATKTKIDYKTPYLWSKKLTPAKKILHNRWL